MTSGAVTADDIAAWGGLALSGASLLLAWASHRRSRNAETAVREIRDRSRRREMLDALDAMERHKEQLEREYAAGDAAAAEATLRRWRDAAQAANNFLESSAVRPDRREAQRALVYTIRRTQWMAGLSGTTNYGGATTMQDAVGDVENCHRAVSALRDHTRRQLQGL